MMILCPKCGTQICTCNSTIEEQILNDQESRKRKDEIHNYLHSMNEKPIKSFEE
jgi:hypothetical protein